jgi:hypothetical protein
MPRGQFVRWSCGYHSAKNRHENGDGSQANV